MRDRGLILAGLAILIGLLTFPIWYNTAVGASSAPPDLQKPVKGDRCIYPTEFMRASHMDVLMEWRDQVVRNGNRLVTVGGRTYTMSLSGTCLDCHSDKARFCDKCHTYSGVSPYCWDCHVDPSLAPKAAAEAPVAANAPGGP